MQVSMKKIRKALEEAIDLSVIRKDEKPDKIRKFDETVDLVINVRDVDIKNPNNRIEQELMLPHGIPGHLEKKKVCFIAKDDMEMKLKELGYPVLNPGELDELNKKSNKEKKQVAKRYAYFVARGDLMRDLAKVLARFLGQQGKMPRPSPKGYGVIRPNEEIDDYVAKLNRIIKVEMKKALMMQLKVGKKSQGVDGLMENISHVLNFVESHLPSGYNNVQNIYIKTTMGQAVKVEEAAKGRG